MPTNTSITINSTDPDNDNKKVTDTINYINPNISDSAAIELAQKINNLTNNSYTETIRTDKRNIDTDSKPAQSIRQIWVTTKDSGYAITNDGTNTFTVSIPYDKLPTVSSSDTNNRLAIGLYGAIDVVPVAKNIPTGYTWGLQYYIGSRWNSYIEFNEVISQPLHFEYDVYLPASDTTSAATYHFIINITAPEG